MPSCTIFAYFRKDFTPLLLLLAVADTFDPKKALTLSIKKQKKALTLSTKKALTLSTKKSSDTFDQKSSDTFDHLRPKKL